MSLANPTVLIIDDEADQREHMRAILRQEHYVVLQASNQAEASMAQARHLGEIDLLLIDVSLPGGNGYDLAQVLLAIEPHLKVLFVSGHAGAELCRFFAEPLRKEQFLQKPFLPGELLRRVKLAMHTADPAADHTSVGS